MGKSIFYYGEEEEDRRADLNRKTGLQNNAEKARLDIILRQLEKSSRTSECHIERYKKKLRQDIIDFEANKAAMRSRHCNFSRVDPLDKEAQKDMLKIVSQRGRYFYSLKNQVRVHRDFMNEYNPRLDRAKRLLVPAKRESAEAMKKGYVVLPPVVDASSRAALESLQRAADDLQTPACKIFPRI